MNRLLFAVLVWALFFGAQGAAQEPRTEEAPAPVVSGAQQPGPKPIADAGQAGRGAAITGRVVTSEGNFAVANARVIARAAGVGGASSLRVMTTDEEGNFQLTDLRHANYLIRVLAPGYISEHAAATPSIYYRPGETVTLRMVKGGVITGRVLNTNGDPMALARVRAVRIRDAEGRLLRDSGTGRDWTTDDRGVYRLYGLEPGAYVVAASSTSMFRPAPSQFRSAAWQGGEAAPTYHPSSPLESATHVNVNAGEETRGIDIRYRAERSYAVRGAVVAAAARAGDPSSRTPVSITLSHAATGVAVVYANLIPTGANTVFNFDGVPDGVYELTAQTAPGTSDAAVALPQRVTVQGADAKGITLTLTPFGAVSGRVLLEKTSAAEAAEACREARPASVEETLVSALRDESPATKQPPSLASLLPVEAQPDAGGQFTLTNMNAGRYSLNVQPPGKLWYVRDIAPGGAATKAGTSTNSPSGGLTLKQGERVQGLTVTLAQGAAGIAGRVVPAADGSALPARLRVYVVPVERERAEDAQRYAETQVQPDGGFAVAHLAPGRYWLVARASADVDASPAARAVILDQKTRAALRRAAESANFVVELQPCQAAEYTLRFTP